MKRILFVMLSLNNGGAERSLVNLLNEIPEGKYDIDILLFRQGGMFLSQVPKHVRVLATPREIHRLYLPIIKSGVTLRRKLIGTILTRFHEKKAPERAAYRWQHYYGPYIKQLQECYDVAIAYASGEVMYYVTEKVKAYKKIAWIHNDYQTAGHPKKYDYPYLESMNAIVSVSDQCVKILKEEFPDLSKKIFYIPNLTSSEVTRKRANEFVPKEYEGCECNLLSVGRLREQKGFDLAISAASIMKNKALKFKWYVLGDGELEGNLKSQIRKENVEDCFFLLGSKDNPYPYIKNCSVVVQTSRYEGKSVVLDEAKILATPIVTTNYPTVGDQIIDGEEGLIVEMSPEGIANGIVKVLNDITLREHLHNYLLSHEYGNQAEVQKYINLIG